MPFTLPEISLFCFLDAGISRSGYTTSTPDPIRSRFPPPTYREPPEQNPVILQQNVSAWFSNLVILQIFSLFLYLFLETEPPNDRSWFCRCKFGFNISHFCVSSQFFNMGTVFDFKKYVSYKKPFTAIIFRWNCIPIFPEVSSDVCYFLDILFLNGEFFHPIDFFWYFIKILLN